MKHIITTLLMLATVCSIQAQHMNKMHERVKAQKIAFITERLNLTAEEAQEFWPIYNTFEDQLENLRKNDMREIRQTMRRDDLSEEEAKKTLDKLMSIEDQVHSAKQQLVKDLKGIISPQKIIALKAAEDAFKKRLLETLKKRRMKNKNNR